MKAFAVWLAGMTLAFGGFAVVYHLVREDDPERVLVVVDSSFPMQTDWAGVPGILDALDDEGYAEFALATEKGLVHGWAEQLVLEDVRVYAPRDFEDLVVGDAYEELAEADELVLVTNAVDAELEGLDAWRIVRP